MLVLPPLVSNGGEGEGEKVSFLSIFAGGDDGFDDIFIGMDEGDVLPDLELDSDMFAKFSLSGGEEPEFDTFLSKDKGDEENGGLGFRPNLISHQGPETTSKKCELGKVDSSPRKGDGGRRSSRTSNGKRKTKVDWTPDLHRKFVQAVEQLGMDKAVPSRILELMGIDCLTRHNIASHLQKYRYHQKHLKAREAEAASWSLRRHMYGGVRGRSKRETTTWLAPTIGFHPPPPPPPPPHTPIPAFSRPLHVWGHPAVDKTLWLKYPAQSPTLPPWTPPLGQLYPPYQHPLHASMRFTTPTVSGMYRVDQGIDSLTGQSHSHPPFDFNPSKESIDAAIGDVLSKPWQPLPLGLKLPSVDSVMSELEHQGLPKIPHTLLDGHP